MKVTIDTDSNKVVKEADGERVEIALYSKEAFEDIREDLGNSYTVTYYPQPNPNEGFRKIAVEIVSDPGKKWRVHSRPGYRPSRVF